MTAVRMGGGLGFYGDSHDPALELITAGDVQYVGFDHLAELTLAILAKDRARDPRLGFARDLIPLLRDLWPAARAHGVRLISNAGGLNPWAAARAAAEVARTVGIEAVIGVVVGDDVMGQLPAVCWTDGGDEPDRVPVFANAYLGAAPIQQALAGGADLVITGRVADSALFLGAAAHALGWDLAAAHPSAAAIQRLAAAAVAGHLLECSGQVTGGNHSGDWRHIEGLDHIGYPIAELDADGRLTITKVTGSGGRVSVDTVREQLLYEVHNPARYLTPDVTVDLTEVELQREGADRVAVRGVRGHARPGRYKVLAGYRQGFLGQGVVGFSWPDALEKAQAAAAIIERQAAARGLSPHPPRAEYLGVSAFHGPLAPAADPAGTNEVYLRMALPTDSRAQAEAFSRLFPPLALSGPPTASGFFGVDRVRELFAAKSGTIARHAVDEAVAVVVRPAARFLDGG